MPNCIIDDIAETRRQIEQSGAMLLGVVINTPRGSGVASHIRQEPLHPFPKAAFDAGEKAKVRA